MLFNLFDGNGDIVASNVHELLMERELVNYLFVLADYPEYNDIMEDYGNFSFKESIIDNKLFSTYIYNNGKLIAEFDFIIGNYNNV